MILEPALLFSAGRVLLGGAFLFAGLRNTSSMPVLAGLMAARGVPLAKLAVAIGVGIEIVAGALLVLGLWPAAAAAALILFLVVATPIFHNFWDHTGLERANHINGTVINVALAGSFLMVMTNAS